MSTKKNRSAAWVVVPVVLLAAFAAWRALESGAFGEAEESAVEGVPVRRGPLTITVVERGNLEAADAVELRNETDTRTQIVSLVEEGTIVEAGTVVCELDVTSLSDDRFQREISVRNAEAAFVKSQQNYEIQKSQNESDIAAAEQDLEFAKQDLDKFLEADRPRTLATAREAIVIATEEFERAKEQVTWSEKLATKGFLTQTELEADRLALTRAEISLEQAERELETQREYELPKLEAQLRAGLAEAERELARVRLQATARIADFEADLKTNEATLQLEQEKLAKIERQIAAGVLVAPRSGMVVYVKEDGGRWGRDDPISKGTEVSPRQGIVSMPTQGGMVAQVSLHESVLKQVRPGLDCTVEVDALPGRRFPGRVKSVAVLPDQQSWFANPNLRLYRTSVEILEVLEDLRPGMSCSVEVLVENIADATYVPVQAVFQDAGESVCFVRSGSGWDRRAVEPGAYNDRWVEVAGGLTEGEVVAMSAPPGFEPRPAPDAERGEESFGPPGGPPGGPPAGAGGERPSGERPEGGRRAGGRPGGGAAAARGAESEGGRDRGEWKRSASTSGDAATGADAAAADGASSAQGS